MNNIKPEPPKTQYIQEGTGDVFEKDDSGNFIFIKNILRKERLKKPWWKKKKN